MSCTFCKSDKVKVDRIGPHGPEIELGNDGKYQTIQDFCCQAQKTNHKYVANAYHPDHRPNMEDVEKW